MKKLLKVLFSLLMVFTCTATNVYAENDNEYKLSVEGTTDKEIYNVGDTVTVKISITENTEGFTYVQPYIVYDASTLEYVRMGAYSTWKEVDPVTGDSSNPLSVEPSVFTDLDNGYKKFFISAENTKDELTGTGDYVYIQFKVISSLTDSTTISIEDNKGNNVIGDKNDPTNAIDLEFTGDEVTVNITKKDPTINLPSIKTTQTAYTGSSISLINKGSSNSGTMLYAVVKKDSATATTSYDDATDFKDDATATGAGYYDVYYKVDPTNEYYGSHGFVGTVEITKATPTYTAPTGLTATYGDKLSDVSLESYTGFVWKDSSLSVGNAGTQTAIAVYTPEDTDNYNTVDVELSIEVAKANPTYTAPTGLTAVYGQKLKDVRLPYNFTWKDDSLSVGNAGTQKATAVYTPTDTANYNTVEVEVSIQVAKNNPVLSGYSAKDNLVYNGENQELINVGTITAGTITYATVPQGTSIDEANIAFTADGYKATNAGTYDVYYKVAGNENYNDISATKLVTATIAKTTPAYTAPTGLTATYGDKLSDVTLPTGFTWTDSTKSVGNAGTNKFTVTYTPIDTTNYNVVENIEVSVVVAKADLNPTTPTGLTVEYGKKLSDVTFNNPDNGTWSWVNPNEDVGNYGDQTHLAKFTPNDTANYNTINNVEVTISVTKVQPTVTSAPTLKTGLAYNTNAQDLITAGVATGGTIKYAVVAKNGETPTEFSVTIPQATNAGEYDVYYKVFGDENHGDTSAIKVGTVTIAKTTPAYTAPTGLTATYGDKLSDVTLPTGFAWTDSTKSVGNAGTNKFTVTYTPTDTTNYNVVENIEVSVVVAKANAVYEGTTDLGEITYGKQVKDIAKPDNNITYTNPNELVGDVTESRTINATYNPDSNNYNDQSIVLTVKVVPAKATDVTAPTATSLTYGQKLSESTLSNASWYWKDGNTAVEVKTTKYVAVYEPTDYVNYDWSEIAGYRTDETGKVYIDRDVNVTVNKATPTITLSKTNVNSTDKVGDVSLDNCSASVDGKFVVNETNLDMLVSDITSNGIKVKFVPTDSTNYNVVYGNLPLVVKTSIEINGETVEANIETTQTTTESQNAVENVTLEDNSINNTVIDMIKISKTKDDAELTELEIKVKEAVDEGKTIQTEFVTEQKDETEVEESLKQSVKGDVSEAIFIDMTIELSIDGDVAGNITELSSAVTLMIPLPETVSTTAADTSKYYRQFYVSRLHNGVVTTEKVNIVNGCVEYENDKFSSFAIFYEDIKIPSQDDGTNDKPVVDTSVR